MGDPIVREEEGHTLTGEPTTFPVYRDSWGEYVLRQDNIKKWYVPKSLTEIGWLGSSDPDLLFAHVRGTATHRKERLLAVIICRRGLAFVPDDRCHKALVIAERYADGLVNEQERVAARQAARSAAAFYAGIRSQEGDGPWTIARGIRQTLDRSGTFSLSGILSHLANGLRHALGTPGTEEQQDLAGDIRHVMGNPFRPYATPTTWPATVVQLAQALYSGEHCSFALHDALIETGDADLAEHFRELGHPKGCWALDMILRGNPVLIGNEFFYLG
jgi:hypothetical protein